MKRILMFLCVVISSLSLNAQNVIKGEYFIDVDSGVGQSANSFSLVQSIDSTWQLSSITANNLSIGYHKLYMRVKDVDGNWSHTIRKNFEVIKSEDSLVVVEVEYFWNDDLEFGNCFDISIPNSASDITYTFNIPFSNLPNPFVANDTLFIRVKDSVNGNWSHTAYIDNINIDTTSTGLLEGIFKSSFTIYPNPAIEFINVETDMYHSQSEIRLSVLNALGELQFQKQINSRNNEVDIRKLSSGIYFLVIETDSIRQIKKFVKQ